MQEMHDRRSEVASSVNSSKMEYYHLLRMAEQTDKRTLRLRWLIIFFIGSYFLTVAFVVACFLFSASTRVTIFNSQQRVETLTTLMGLQLATWTNVDLLMRQSFIYKTLGEEDLVGVLLPQPAQLASSSDLQNVKASLNRVYNTTYYSSYFEFSFDRSGTVITDLSGTVEIFEMSRWENKLFDTETRYMDGAEVDMFTFQSLDQESKIINDRVAIPQAVRSIVTLSSNSFTLLKEIEPYMIGKEPPFNMPEEVANKLAQALLKQLTSISNTLENLIFGVMIVLNRVTTLILISDANIFNLRFWIAVSLLTAGLLLYVILLSVSSARVDAGLQNTTMMYQLLKVNEAESHIIYYSNIEEKLRQFSLDEASMISHFSAMNKMPTVHSHQPTHHSPHVHIKKTKQKTRLASIKPDIRLDSLVVLRVSSLIVIAALAAVALFLAIIGIMLKEFLRAEAFYIESHKKVSAISQKYLIFYTLATLGNFIKIDGKYPEDEWGSNYQAANNFGDFWLSKASELKKYIGDEEFELLNKMFREQICEYLPQNKKFEIFLYHLCTEYQPAQHGLFPFLLEEGKVFENFEYTQMPKNGDFLRISRSEYMKTPFIDFLLDKSQLVMSQIHFPIVSTFIIKYFGAMSRSMDIRIKNYDVQVIALESIGIVTIFVLLISSTILTVFAVCANQRVAMETTSTIRPNVLKNNPFIQMQMNDSFMNFEKL